MGHCCDLEVDVNGEEVFLVDKNVLSAFCGRLNKLLGQSTVATMKTSKLKVLFHDFPGGAEAFELMTRFCYNHDSFLITTSNVCVLHCVAHYMEMSENLVSHTPNLLEQTEKILEETGYCTWPQILILVRQCQDLYPAAQSSGILEKCLDPLVARIAFTSNTSPSMSSPDSSGFRFSFDARSSQSTKSSFHHRHWLLEDLVGFNSIIISKIIERLVHMKFFDQVVISRFLFYYLKFHFSISSAKEKQRLVETIVNLLFLLDRNSISCKGLFSILRTALGVNISKDCRSRLESMIGCLLDQATLDDLLIPSSFGKSCLYDVNMVLRLMKSFLSSSGDISLSRLRSVGRMLDIYISEVAPDAHLKPSKFIALLMALPDAARENYDEICRAVDIYLQVHKGLSEKEKMKVCSTLNYEKLSLEACKHLVHNLNFASSLATETALFSPQSKLKSLVQDANATESSDTLSCTNQSKEKSIMNSGHTVLFTGKFNLVSENEDIKAHLQGMHWRVMELEKACKKMQTQMTKFMKNKAESSSSLKSFPKLCS